ncbi:hypothetical protein [Sphingomonas trueperi]|uniref:hypothetical protein n=1 Tax=Sphingomonas trueperi TaxID=53317 RepID=UPI000F1807FA
MSRGKVMVNNRSEQKLAALVVFHTPSLPEPQDLQLSRAVINVAGPEHGLGANGDVDLPTSPFDFWMLGCRFEGDDAGYAMSNISSMPFKEFAISDGDRIEFEIREAGLPGHYPVDVKLNGDYSATAKLVNAKELVVLELVEVLLGVIGGI